jgi:imidazole glycerol phosphate synthase subunit HisF
MPMKDVPMLKVLRQTSEKVFVPLTIGYGPVHALGGAVGGWIEQL